MKSERNGRIPAVTVSIRRQTPAEHRRFEAALQLLLTQMVRQEIARRKDTNEGEFIPG